MNSYENQKTTGIIQEIVAIFNAQGIQDATANGADLTFQKTRRRLVTNNAIVSKESIVDDLALRTKGTSMEEELDIAIERGMNLVGDTFGHALINEIHERLYRKE